MKCDSKGGERERERERERQTVGGRVRMSDLAAVNECERARELE